MVLRYVMLEEAQRLVGVQVDHFDPASFHR